MSRLNKADEIIELAMLLQNSYQGLSIDDIAEHFECSNRSAERMKALLTDKYPNAIEMVESLTKKKRWRFKKGIINQFISFSQEDFLNLEHCKNLCTETKQEKEIEQLITKIKSLNSKGSIGFENDIEFLLKTQGYAVKQYLKENIAPEVYSTIKDALLEQKQLQFDYTTNEGYKFRATVNPYGVQFGHRNYLVAFSQYDKEILKYKIGRIKNIEKLDEYFERDETFDLKEYCEKSFGIYSNEPMEIELLFSKEVRDDVLNYHFHPTQKVVEQDSGDVLVKFQASGEREICNELFIWGGYVKVLEPSKLKECYKNTLEYILKNL